MVQSAARKENFPPEYFLAADRGDVNIINMKGIKFDSFHHFSEKFCLGVTHQCCQKKVTQIM